MLPSPDFAPNIVPVFKSPQEVAQQSFQRQTFFMLFTLLAQGELKMQSRSPQGCCQQAFCYTNNSKWPEESWDEGCGEEEKAKTHTTSYRKERLDFAIRHQHWTLEDWKKVVWSDESQMRPKSIGWVQMAGNGCGKRQERV